MKYGALFLIIVVFIIFAFLINSRTPFDSNSLPFQNWNRISIGGEVLDLEVVWTEADRNRGLSGRANLPSDTGMFFIFPESGPHFFWMKDMNFAIDIIWFDKDLNVVDIKKNLEPSSYPKTFAPLTPAQYALEVNAGLLDSLKIKIGDQAKILN